MLQDPSTNTGMGTGIAAKKVHWSLSTWRKIPEGVITIERHSQGESGGAHRNLLTTTN